jgi:hypothetical protein
MFRDNRDAVAPPDALCSLERRLCCECTSRVGGNRASNVPRPGAASSRSSRPPAAVNSGRHRSDESGQVLMIDNAWSTDPERSTAVSNWHLNWHL